ARPAPPAYAIYPVPEVAHRARPATPRPVPGTGGSVGSDVIDRGLQILGVVAFEFDPLLRVGMAEAELDRMQPLPFETELLGQHGIGPIGQIAHARMFGGGEVDAELMGAAGLEVDLDECGSPMRLDHLVVGDRVLAYGAHGVEAIVLRVPGDRGVDRAEHRVGQSLDESVVGLVD